MEKKPKPEITKTKPINIMLQEGLIKRINIKIILKTYS